MNPLPVERFRLLSQPITVDDVLNVVDSTTDEVTVAFRATVKKTQTFDYCQICASRVWCILTGDGRRLCLTCSARETGSHIIDD